VKEIPLFEKVNLVGEIKNEFSGERGIRGYLLKGAKQSMNAILLEEILLGQDKP